MTDTDGYDTDGFHNGFDREGYDRSGYNLSGYDRNGFDREGYDRNCYNRYGYDRNGRDRNDRDQYMTTKGCRYRCDPVDKVASSSISLYAKDLKMVSCILRDWPKQRFTVVHLYPDMHDPMDSAPDDMMIGYAVAHPSGKGIGVQCLTCGPDSFSCEVYGININPYKVTCVKCGRLVVQGCGTELFDGK